jgi:carbon monoxide dehydrogenase subunit G
MDFVFQGDFELLKNREEVYAMLTDPKRFAPLLPNIDHLEVHDDEEFTVQLKVGLAFIKSTATIRMALAESEPPRSAVYKGDGKVAGESLTIRAAFALDGNGPRTGVHWKGEATLAGRLPAAVANLMEPVARQSINTLIDSIKSALA